MDARCAIFVDNNLLHILYNPLFGGYLIPAENEMLGFNRLHAGYSYEGNIVVHLKAGLDNITAVIFGDINNFLRIIIFLYAR